MTVPPTRLVLVGHPVSHSLSPRMQRAALAAAGVAATYDAIDVAPERLAATVAALRRDGAAGNVTVPHKERFAALADVLTPTARRVGAANTFWIEDGALVADNTDVAGFDAAMRALLGAATPHRIALLGAGGAARAVLAAAERWPAARVVIHNRSVQRAERLVAEFAGVASRAESVGAALRDADVVVNATSVGLAGDALPIAIETLPPEVAVLDLVYREGETPWVRAARAAGHPALDGLTMLVEQGAAAFERWFGVAPDRGAMWAALGRSEPARPR